MSDNTSHTLQPRLQVAALDPNLDPNNLRQDPPYLDNSSRFVRKATLPDPHLQEGGDNKEQTQDKDPDLEQVRVQSATSLGQLPTPSAFEPIDPATFQQHIFPMMQQLTRAMVNQTNVTQQSATPFKSRVREPKVNNTKVFDG